MFFGGKKIPELMKGVGKGVKSFKDGLSEIDIDDKKENNNRDIKEEESKKSDE